MIRKSVQCTLLLTEFLQQRQMKSILKWLTYHPLETCLILLLFALFVFIQLQQTNIIPDMNNALKQKAKYPTPTPKLLTDTPKDCVVLGKWKKQYVHKPLTESGHVLLIGGSGSGKSSALGIPTLLTQDNACLCVDIKGELSFKSVDINDEKNVIFNPLDSASYGYDPLWQLETDNGSEQLLVETMQEIVFSLIPLSPSLKDPYWTLSARTLLLGLMLFEYNIGHHNLIDIIDQIQSMPIKSLLEIIEENEADSSLVYRTLSQFFELSDVTLGCIYSNALQKLSVFTTDAYIRYAFRDNPKKMNPSMLENGKRIFLSIPENYLDKYATILHLIINQSFGVLASRPETAPPVLIMIDELPRILSVGKIDSLLDAARTLRSRNVTIFLITQSIEALEIAFNHNEVTDLISNCPYIVVLSASSEDTIRKIRMWGGKYMSPHYSYSDADKKTTISYNEQDIIDGMELMTLAQSGEAILSTPYGYFRVKKTPYYSDKYFFALHKKLTKNNRTKEANPPVIPEPIKQAPTPPPLTSTEQNSLLEWDESPVSLDELEIELNNLEFHTTE